MTNERGETFLVGKDLAKALGYSNTSKTIQQHVDRKDKGTLPFWETAYKPAQEQAAARHFSLFTFHFKAWLFQALNGFLVLVALLVAIAL